jgi:hypothetical protein
MPILVSQAVRNGDDNYFLEQASNGNVNISGTATMAAASITGVATMGGANVLGDISLEGTIYDSTRALYPTIVRIGANGTITKSTSVVAVPNSEYTIPLTGYYSFTAQIVVGTVGTVADGDTFALFLDIDGGTTDPINGTSTVFDMTENTDQTFTACPSGIIMERLTAGQIVRAYHRESGSFTFGNSYVKVAYSYLGDTVA